MDGMKNNLMDWDDSIESDGNGYVILEEGDYVFEITNFERGRHPGSAKVPACNKASITLKMETEQGTAFAFENLYLYRTMEWKLSEFFRSIGQKKAGERLVMNWNTVLGARGRVHIVPATYKGSDGQTHEKNQVTRYLDYDESKMPKPAGVDEDGFMQIPDDAADELPFN